MNKIELQTISKSYENTLVLDRINLQVKDKETLVLLGPSGCGKSTLLRIIANLEEQSKGRMMKRSQNIGYMFQKDNLLPWLTIKENIEFGLKIKGIPSTKETDTLLEEFHLEAYKNKYPKELSGGMRQRVSLIRALITHPDIILLDEPFSSLDYKTKLKIQEETKERIQNKTTILVTHNLKEALDLGDRIVILTKKPTRIKKIITNTKDPSLEKELEAYLDEA